MDATKLNGILLAVGAILWTLMIGAWPLFIGDVSTTSPDGIWTIPERATHLLEKQAAYRGIWLLEAAGTLCIAIAAFGLARRDNLKSGIAPLGWTAAGIGMAVYLVFYGVMLGTYWPAAAARETPALLETAIVTATTLFLISNIAFGAGLAVVFLAETRSEKPAVPKWACWVAMLLSVLTLAASVAGLIITPAAGAAKSVDAFALVAAAHFLLIAWLGIGIARSSPV